MALYAIADLHLSLGTDKPMDVFRGWENYVERLEKNWRALVTEEDTVVIAGDISWGMRLEETGKDFAFIESLPGKKLLLKGNHDYWWSTRNKIETFFAQKGFKTMQLVFNSAERVGDITVCGALRSLYQPVGVRAVVAGVVPCAVGGERLEVRSGAVHAAGQFLHGDLIVAGGQPRAEVGL